MKFELNDLTPLLDLLAQPAFCTEDGVVWKMRESAAA